MFIIVSLDWVGVSSLKGYHKHMYRSIFDLLRPASIPSSNVSIPTKWAWVKGVTRSGKTTCRRRRCRLGDTLSSGRHRDPGQRSNSTHYTYSNKIIANMFWLQLAMRGADRLANPALTPHFQAWSFSPPLSLTHNCLENGLPSAGHNALGTTYFKRFTQRTEVASVLRNCLPQHHDAKTVAKTPNFPKTIHPRRECCF